MKQKRKFYVITPILIWHFRVPFLVWLFWPRCWGVIDIVDKPKTGWLKHEQQIKEMADASIEDAFGGDTKNVVDLFNQKAKDYAKSHGITQRDNREHK